MCMFFRPHTSRHVLITHQGDKTLPRTSSTAVLHRNAFTVIGQVTDSGTQTWGQSLSRSRSAAGPEKWAFDATGLGCSVPVMNGPRLTPCGRSLALWALIGLLSVSCSRATNKATPAPNGTPASAAPKPSPSPSPSVVVFTGMCDASGAVALSDRKFVVADDEDNVLRVYDVERGGAPLGGADVSRGLKLPLKKKKKKPGAPVAPEADIEAAARLGDRAYFMTSHGRNSKGKLKPERLRFFATTTPEDGDIEVIGEPYDSLLDDLLAEPRLARFELAQAAELAPKAPGGLNLEGMTARKEGGVWLGFRNPIPEGRALLLPLLNPEELVTGKKARFGEPVLLDLGGLGVRSLSSYRDRYLIAAGPFDQGASARLFAWDGGPAAEPLDRISLEGFNPEGFFTPESRDRIMLLSDDGSVSIDGTDCKRLKDPAAKRFRGVWVALPLSKG